MIHVCKKCGSLYTDSLGSCPKCGSAELQEELTKQQQAGPPADRSAVRKQWIGILIGIPALILFLYFVVYLFHSVTG